jgi:plastocyanin
MRSRVAWGFFAACAVALTIGACGGNNGSPTPTPTPEPTNTITIANNAVSPKSIIVPRGSQVTFVNNDNRTHDMESNPHPEHTDCPALMQVGFLSPGQSRSSGNLNTARICGYHDHNLAEVVGLQGTITVQ